jgi:hypothetical protein
MAFSVAKCRSIFFMTLKFLALQGALYIYDISMLRVNVILWKYTVTYYYYTTKDLNHIWKLAVVLAKTMPSQNTATSLSVVILCDTAWNIFQVMIMNTSPNQNTQQVESVCPIQEFMEMCVTFWSKWWQNKLYSVVWNVYEKHHKPRKVNMICQE